MLASAQLQTDSFCECRHDDVRQGRREAVAAAILPCDPDVMRANKHIGTVRGACVSRDLQGLLLVVVRDKNTGHGDLIVQAPQLAAHGEPLPPALCNRFVTAARLTFLPLAAQATRCSEGHSLTQLQ
jgi:hypothetical protein